MFTSKPATAPSEAFVSACNEIESDVNYRENRVTDLLQLTVDANTNNSAPGIKIGLVFYPLKQTTSGKIYGMDVATKDYPDDEATYKTWLVKKLAVLVKANGETSIHTLENAENNIFNAPKSWKVSDYLGRDSVLSEVRIKQPKLGI